jgi:acetoin utilization deacetylase AcuC-like enzyme
VQTPQIRKTGFVYAEQFMWHDTQRYNLLVAPGLTVQPGEHAENEETKRRFRNLVAVTTMEDELIPIKARPCTDAELLRFHTPKHISNLDELCKAGGGVAGGKSPVGPYDAVVKGLCLHD